MPLLRLGSATAAVRCDGFAPGGSFEMRPRNEPTYFVRAFCSGNSLTQPYVDLAYRSHFVAFTGWTRLPAGCNPGRLLLDRHYSGTFSRRSTGEIPQARPWRGWGQESRPLMGAGAGHCFCDHLDHFQSWSHGG